MSEVVALIVQHGNRVKRRCLQQSLFRHRPNSNMLLDMRLQRRGDHHKRRWLQP